jgi:mannose-1-phosphate guanylyltransferase
LEQASPQLKRKLLAACLQCLVSDGAIKAAELQLFRALAAGIDCPNISIDYGVMEKAENVFTTPAEFGWSDIGSWDSLYDVYEHDYLGNAVSGKNVKIYDSANNMIMVPDDKLVVLQGLRDYCVVDTGDVLLVCEKSKEQEIKQITVDLKVADLDKYL